MSTTHYIKPRVRVINLSSSKQLCAASPNPTYGGYGTAGDGAEAKRNDRFLWFYDDEE